MQPVVSVLWYRPQCLHEFRFNLGYSHFCNHITAGQDGQTFERNSTMPILRYLIVSLASALMAT